MLKGLPPSKRLLHLEGQLEVEQSQNIQSPSFSPAVGRPHKKASLEILESNRSEYFLCSLLIDDHDYFQLIEIITKAMTTSTDLHGI